MSAAVIAHSGEENRQKKSAILPRHRRRSKPSQLLRNQRIAPQLEVGDRHQRRKVHLNQLGN